jgi:O-antigen/teichoic acid export membrane protein
VLNAGASMLAHPHAVTMRRQGDVPALGRRVSGMLAGVSCIWACAVVLLPDSLGRAVVGVSWDDSLPTRVLLGVSLVAEAVLVGQVAALSALRDTRRLARIRTVSAPITVATSLVLAALFGAAGAAGGFAFGYWTAAAIAFTLLLRRPPVGRRLVLKLHAATGPS